MWNLAIKWSLRSLRSHLRQSVAVIFTLSVAYFSLLVFMGYMTDVKSKYERLYRHENMYGDLIIENPQRLSLTESPWTSMIDVPSQEILKTFLGDHSGVEEFVTFLEFEGVAGAKGPQQFVVGTGFDLKSGARVQGVPELAPIQLAQGLARNFGCKSLTAQGPCSQLQFQVSVLTEAGFLNARTMKAQALMTTPIRELNERSFRIPLGEAQSLLQTQGLSFISILLKPDFSERRFRQSFEALKHQKIVLKELRVIPWRDHPLGELYKQSMSFLGAFQIFILLILLIIAATTAISSTTRLLQERAREIGTLRAIGFSPRLVQLQTSVELVGLSLLASGIGVLFVLLFRYLLGLAKIPYRAGLLAKPILFEIQPIFVHFVVGAFVIGCIVGTVAWTVSRRFSLQSVQKLLTC
ncbi:MAG: FtsX-like permease family protein [Bdellovibrio sp.]